jgi:opacity protein-like surface antigen
MSRRNAIAVLVSAVALVAPASAFAATPQQIFADAADGQLNGHYSSGDLTRARYDSTVQGYGNQIVQITLKNQVTAKATAKAVVHEVHRVVYTPPVRHYTPVVTVRRATLPFTGSHLATFVSLGIVLLAGGLLLRMMARRSSVT